MLGIDNLKKAISVGLEVPKKISEATADGKVTIIEIVGFVPIATDVIGEIKAWPEIRAEIDDLEDDEREELYQYFSDKFDIPNDRVELFVEHAVKNLLSTIALVEEFRDLKKPEIGPTKPPVK